MTYNKTTWIDDVTPLDAEHLNNMEDGIEKMYKATINGKTLLDNPSLTAADVDALPASTKIPIVDKKFSANSENAQSGKAVSEAVSIEQKRANNTFAPAIKNTVSGSVLAVHDVSPVEHDLDVRVRSKNLIPYPYPETTKTVNGVTFIDNHDGTITVNGTAMGGMPCFDLLYTSQQNNLEVGKTYTLSGCASGGSDTTYRLRITSGGISDIGNGNTFVLQSKGSIQIQIMDGVTVENLVFKPQLELGTTATEYTPYVVDLSAVSVSRCGKNIFDFESFANEIISYPRSQCEIVEFDGRRCLKITYIDGAVSRNLSKFKAFGIRFNYYNAGTYTKSFFSFKNIGGATTYIGGSTLNEWATVNYYYQYADKQIVEFSCYCLSDEENPIYIDLDSFMIEESQAPTDYEPYNGQTATANADGSVDGLTSLSPNITVTTDTEGVVIDMTYNADTKMYIDNKLAEISTAIVNNV